MRERRTTGTRRIELASSCHVRTDGVSEVSPLLAFALTALIIEITPGPNMTYLAALSLSSGLRTGLAAVAGIALGLLTYGIIATFGLAATIEEVPLLYDFLRWGGVLFLL